MIHFLVFQLTLLNAGRKYLGLNSLSGKVFLTSGLGGMSGAQAKASFFLYFSLISFGAIHKQRWRKLKGG